MKKALLAILLILVAITAQAKKARVSLGELICGAELILTGEVVALDDTTYTFKIEQTIVGKTADTIVVKRFENWKCDHRYQAYAVGEKLCLFLYRWNGEWITINGTDGEKPIVNGFIVPDGIYRPDVHRATISIDEFIATMNAFRRCYTYIGELYDIEPYRFKQLVPDKDIEAFSKLNWVSMMLYAEMKDTENVLVVK